MTWTKIVTAPQHDCRECIPFSPNKEHFAQAIGARVQFEGVGVWRGLATMMVVSESERFHSAFAAKVTRLGGKLLSCRSAGQCLEEVHNQRPSVVLIECADNLALGLQLCRSLKSIGDLAEPAIILWIGETDHEGRLAADQVGCDEIIQDNMVSDQAILRIIVALRRAAVSPSRDVLRVADLTLDARNYRLLILGRSLTLTVSQTELLRLFMEHPGQVFSRTLLTQRLWPGREVNEGSIKMAVGRLRRIFMDGLGYSPIHHIRGQGYSLDPELGRASLPDNRNCHN